MKRTILCVTMLFPWLSGYAQEKQEKEKGVWELSPSYIYSYVPSLSEGLFKTELHLTYWINAEWGGGFSYTHKFINSSEINDDLALIGSWNAASFLTFHLGLNYTIPKKREDGFFGVYNEAEINFRPKKWYAFGPLIGSVLSKRTELYGGVHVAFEF
jgi:hypothetical protein